MIRVINNSTKYVWKYNIIYCHIEYMFQGITGPSSVLNDMTWKVTLVYMFIYIYMSRISWYHVWSMVGMFISFSTFACFFVITKFPFTNSINTSYWTCIVNTTSPLRLTAKHRASYYINPLVNGGSWIWNEHPSNVDILIWPYPFLGPKVGGGQNICFLSIPLFSYLFSI